MDSDEQQIRRLERERCEALTSGDVAALAALMADDLIHIHGNGHIDRVVEYLEGVKTKYIFHRIERGELDIRIYGDAAVVVGSLDQTVEVRGNDKRNEIRALASQTWIRRVDGWKQNTCHMHFLSVA
jgi:ketosteroid isomerase-like protein